MKICCRKGYKKCSLEERTTWAESVCTDAIQRSRAGQVTAHKAQLIVCKGGFQKYTDMKPHLTDWSQNAMAKMGVHFKNRL